MPNEEYLTTAEAAALLKVSKSTVRMLAREGQLPAVRVGVQWRIPHEAPELWLYRQKQAAVRGKSSLKTERRAKRSGFDDLLKISGPIRLEAK
ncbi:MAG: helix-turn-helix domain-containing protein [Calditrichaeota bacterium]|nr:helix-turn-helix domain-containing protein [Calditrichota bacterium]MCB9369794.1 helix-turn-helix domain-containing protein [Calditrichota bacterium]